MTVPSTLHELPSRLKTQVNLRTLCRAIPGSILTAPPASPGWRRDVRIQPDRPGIDLADVTPLEPAGVVDGAQCRVLLAARQGRPLLLEYVGAGAVSGDAGKPIDLEERMYLAGSHLDSGFLRRLPEGLPVVELDGIDPAVVGAEAFETVGRFREMLEATVAARVGSGGDSVVVDGSVRHIALTCPTVGVVKNTSSTQWLTDESELRSLRVGWRSTVFAIPAQRRGEVTVHSCYVRLHDVSSLAFTDGLIRVECNVPELLDAAAAWAIRSRQHPGSGDTRWACQLRQVRKAELFLKGRMPAALPVSR